MIRLLKFSAGLALMISLAGCCYRPGYYDPVTGMAYGGYWEPCCGGPLDPFCLWSCGASWGCGCGAAGYWGGPGGCGCSIGGPSFGSSTVVSPGCASPGYVSPGYGGVVEQYPSETVYHDGYTGHSHPHSYISPGAPSQMAPSDEWQPADEWQPSDAVPTPQPAPPAEEDTSYQTYPPDAYYPSSRVSPRSGGPARHQAQPSKWIPARF